MFLFNAFLPLQPLTLNGLTPVRLKILDVLDSIILGYPQKGHTHGPLDGTFGQCCVKIGNEQFDSANHVVQILQTFLDNAVLEAGAKHNKLAYKLDESPSWEAWWDELNLQMGCLTGPLAPHWFRICSRKDLDSLEQEAPATAWAHAPPSDPGDIVCAVKDRMASARSHQVALLVPASEIKNLQQSLSIQPQGLHPRRPIKKKDAQKVIARAGEVLSEGLISQEAHDFLVGWASSSLPRNKRPSTYNFLQHRCNDRSNSKSHAICPSPRFHHPHQREPRPIRIYRSDGEPLPNQTDDGQKDPIDELALDDFI